MMTAMNTHKYQDELALGDQVGLAGFVNQFRDLAHRAMDGSFLSCM